MPRQPTKSKANAKSTASLGFEAKPWLTADKLRNNMDAAEYKHVVLGLTFLKYISDTFEEHRARLIKGEGDYAGANPEDPDEYNAENVFWVPAKTRWSHLQASPKQPAIGKIVDDDRVVIERDNPRLKGVLPTDYARPGLDKQRLGELIDVIATPSNSLSPARKRRPTARSTYLAACTSISSPASPASRARTAGSTTRRAAWCAKSSRCPPRTRAASTTLPAASVQQD